MTAPAPNRTATVRERTTRESARVLRGDCFSLLPTLPSSFARLIYIDPPFNTGQTQHRPRIHVARDPLRGDRTGFGGKRYRTTKSQSPTGHYADSFDDYLAFLMPRI